MNRKLISLLGLDTYTYIRGIHSGSRPANFNTIILGDVHLGLNISRVEALIEYLLSIEFKTLIFQGDTFNRPDFKTLPVIHQHFLELIRRFEKNGVKVIWVKGNHDTSLPKLLAKFYRSGCAVYDEYEFKLSKRKFLVLHGDRFDDFITNNARITDLSTWIYELIADIEFDIDMSLAAALKYLAKDKILKIVDVLRHRSVEMASKRNLDVVVMGHTHHIEHSRLYDYKKNRWRHYYNVGCFTQKRCGIVGVDKKGFSHLVKIHTWRRPRLR